MFHQLASLIHRAFGRNKLRPYERACIDAWRSTLSARLKWRLDEQLTRFDLVQRQARGTKTVFYSVRDPGYTSWSDDVLFHPRGEEQKVFAGSVSARIGDVTESFRFCIYLHRGRLSSLEFSSEPGAISKLSDGLVIVEAEVLTALS